MVTPEPFPLPQAVAGNGEGAMADEGFRTTNRVFEEEVVGSGDFGALSRVYTREARILPPGAPMVTGLDAITGFWRRPPRRLGSRP